MDDIIKYDEKIDSYLKNALEGKELENFINEIKSNQELAQEVKLRQRISDEFAIADIKDVRKRLTEIQKDEGRDLDLVKKPSSRLWLYLLLFAIVASMLFYFTNTSKNQDGAELQNNQFASYYEPLDANFSQRGNQEKQILTFEKAYENKNYNKSLEQLSIIMADNNEPKWELFKGICHFELNQYDQALTAFQKVNSANDILWSDHGTWYAALTLLKLEANDRAKIMLTKLSQDADADHYQEAKEILDLL